MLEKVTVVGTVPQAIGADEEGVTVELTKTSRVPDLAVGDVVAGHYLNDDEEPDNFYFEVSHRTYKAV